LHRTQARPHKAAPPHRPSLLANMPAAKRKRHLTRRKNNKAKNKHKQPKSRQEPSPSRPHTELKEQCSKAMPNEKLQWRAKKFVIVGKFETPVKAKA
jgi:hypothetical protein